MLATPLFGSGFSGKYLTMSGKLELPHELDRGTNEIILLLLLIEKTVLLKYSIVECYTHTRISTSS